MRAFHLGSLVLVAGLAALSSTACGGSDTNGTGGAGASTTSTGGTGAGGSTGGSTASTGGSTGGTGTGGSTGTAGSSTGGSTTTGTGGSEPVTTADCSPAEGAVPALKRTPIAEGLNSPMFVRAAPGDDERLFIVEQGGTIRLVKNGALVDEPFLDISDRVLSGGERGLLGLAFHPDYQANGRFFVFYTDDNGDQTIVEFARDPANADLAVQSNDGSGKETQKLLTVQDNESNHNGGMLEFSPMDGFLYIGLGDGGGGGDNHGAFGNGLNLGTMWGKILRVDVDKKENGNNYGIPAGNMTSVPANNPSSMVLPEIWDFGLRNPWRFSHDPCTGDLYIGDVGQGTWEEVDVEPAGEGNRNYGWKAYEGTHVFDNNLSQSGQDWTMPVDEYQHSGGNCSITGGVVFRSTALPALRGTYIYGDYCTGRIWTFRWDGAGIQDKTERTQDLDNPGNLSSFGQDNLGNVYVVEISGTVSRIDPE